jgi:Cu-Zn family superoxide dismutase
MPFLALMLLGCRSQPLGIAEVRDADGKDVGVAYLALVPDGVSVDATFRGLPPGWHAVHVHAAGTCEPPGFESAGEHYNPFSKRHGRQNPEGSHAGDLPDVFIEDDGSGRFTAVLASVTLVGDSERSLFHPGGTALVVHAEPDDGKTDPAGNTGKRIACGAIKLR